MSHTNMKFPKHLVNNIKHVYNYVYSKLFTCIYIFQSTIGWYRYRHNASHRMSMKEKSIHQTLLKNIPPDKQENFIFILCTSQKSENVSTSNFDFTVFKYSIRYVLL